MNMKNLFFLAILFGNQLVNPCSNVYGQDWISLFNGNSLEGWTVKCLPEDAGKTYWKVNNAAIECNSLGNADHNYVWL
ncbi:hypothetical protein ACFLT1_08670, partial [Bacteroidota bacterium]